MTNEHPTPSVCVVFAERHGAVAPIDAIGPAMNHMIKVLFKPFSIIKWLKFGLVAFLMSLGGGGSCNFNFNMPSGDSNSRARGLTSPPEEMVNWMQTAGQWIQGHLALVIGLVVVAALVISIIWMVLIYFSSRFQLVFLDGVVKNDMQIKRAYKENRQSAWSYFLWNIIFGPTVLLGILLVIGVPATFIILAGIKSGFSAGIIIGLVCLGLLVIGLIILLVIVSLFVMDFVLPIMYLQKLRVLKAWGVFWALLKNNKLQFFLYLLMRIVLGLAGIVAMLVPCCLIGAVSIPFWLMVIGLCLLAIQFPLVWIGVIPLIIIAGVVFGFIWQTILSPFTIFFRSYSLVFLEGFGDEFRSITPNINKQHGDKI